MADAYKMLIRSSRYFEQATTTMKTFLTNLIDQVTTALCSAGPLSFIGAWWWRRRLASVHSCLEMEHYERRS